MLEDKLAKNKRRDLLWMARLVSLAPWVLLSILIAWAMVHLWIRTGRLPNDLRYLVFLTVIPGIIAWRWHRIGGIIFIIMFIALICLTIYVIVFVPSLWVTTTDVVVYFYIALPLLAVTLTGAILHIKVWLDKKEAQK